MARAKPPPEDYDRREFTPRLRSDNRPLQRRTASVRLWAEHLRMICCTCILTVFSERQSLAAISLLGSPSASSASTLFSRGVRPAVGFSVAWFVPPLNRSAAGDWIAPAYSLVGSTLDDCSCFKTGSGRYTPPARTRRNPAMAIST